MAAGHGEKAGLIQALSEFGRWDVVGRGNRLPG
jgi:hypothetical protein